ncbi:MAG: DUF1579 domain-containing protein [Acidobacteriota bacterium]|nr:DUF1579 domain-containing protein [Acidobacteriota bacterium]
MRLKVYLGACAILLSSMATLAQDHSKQMSPEEKAAMDSMMKAAAPGEMHKKLAGMVGKWSATVKMYAQPGAPAQVSNGTSENKMVLGGRWVQETFNGSFMGMPFSGIGYTGYDNMKKQYVGTWMDTMSTSMMQSAGTADASGKTFEFNSTMDDPMTGKSVAMKSTVTVADNNHHTMEMWAPAPDGKMFKMMEINYTRKK